VRLRRNRAARRFTLQVHGAHREAVLTLPLRGSLAQAKVFAENHGVWLAERLRQLPQAVPFADGATVPLRGTDHRVVHRPSSRGTVWVEAGPGGESLLCVAGGEGHLARRINDFLRREARRDLGDAVARHATTLNVRYARLTVRDTSSRWGSCSSTGTLSFSWRLIFAPPHVLDYLAAHEVAHLVEMNHSRKFWRLVFGLCPDLRAAKDWLNTHGGDLHRFGADEAGSGAN
jgi:predicted metal-dependent hydrolase